MTAVEAVSAGPEIALPRGIADRVYDTPGLPEPGPQLVGVNVAQLGDPVPCRYAPPKEVVQDTISAGSPASLHAG